MTLFIKWLPEELRVFIGIVKACVNFRTLQQEVHVNYLHILSFLFKGNTRPFYYKQDRQCTYNISLRCVRVTIVSAENQTYFITWVCICSLGYLRGATDKSLVRSTSRCRRTESILSLERGVCSCNELQVFSCYRG